jgi:hybrid cluster-associated redox disulfide protein
MGCVGCSIARGETIREAAEAHGIPLPELLKALGIKE